MERGAQAFSYLDLHSNTDLSVNKLSALQPLACTSFVLDPFLLYQDLLAAMKVFAFCFSFNSVHLLHAGVRLQRQRADALFQLQESTSGGGGEGLPFGDCQEGKGEG